MPSRHDDSDRKEAARLLLVAAVAILLLIAICGLGVSYFTGVGIHELFASGLSLKGAALIAFIVSFILLLVMAVITGGDAISAQLPFTVAGFLIFFLILWLMIAWIF